MSYESRLFVGSRNVSKGTDGKELYKYFIKIADFEMTKTIHGDDRELFDKEIDFEIYGDMVDGYEARLSIDKYGEKCRYTSVDKYILWLESAIKKYPEMIHRRYKPLLMWLKTFVKETRKDEFYNDEELIVVHYGD